METIEEQSKCEEMSISPAPSPENLRICLVGVVVDDKDTVDAAQTFGVPVITSETGLEIVSDLNWTTYFILNDFDGEIFDVIHKSKHRIMGPPALQQAVKMKEGLINNNRPVYNFSMRGVITCFTGIRKKDELTRLVNLIHSMGGSIRKDMNSKVTHLICNASGGEKYQYAKTFRLAVIRSGWVYDAWENRDVLGFQATNNEFTSKHKLKAFEGQRICFFGFSPEEHEHMVDVLKNNGGIPTDIEDPECSHVIMANTGGHFPENLQSSRNSSPVNPCSDDDGKRNVKGSDDNEQIYKENHQDGAVITSNEEDMFSNPNNISPIFPAKKCSDEEEEEAQNDNGIALNSSENLSDSKECKKRPRDSFDNISIISTDSIALNNFNSAKKPKLTRTGSITRSIKRSMSFMQFKTPIKNILRPRRNSVDPNATIGSIVSVESNLNESTSSIKRPVREKLRNIRNRITKPNKRGEISITPKHIKKCGDNFGSNKIYTPELMKVTDICETDLTDFKTPLAPVNISSPPHDIVLPILPSSPYPMTPATTSSISHRHSVCGVGNANLDTNPYNSSAKTPPIRKSYPADDDYQADVCNTDNTISNCPAIENVTTVTTTNAIAANASAITENECNNLCPSSDNFVVVEEHTVHTKPEPKNNKTHIVKSDWFWYTIQNGFADELDYLFGDYLDSIANTPAADRRDSLPISFNKRKRKRFSQRLNSESTPLSSGKRRSSVSDAGLLSVTGSFLDCTTSPEKHESIKLIAEPEPVIESTPKNKTMRYNHFMDFYNTESNYVGILDTIVNLFKTPLEEKAETNDALLNKSEVRAIFNNFLPIHDVHSHMLERLKELQLKWQEDCLIGQIILDHRDDLMKAYPPYVNFFEQMKETLIQCDTQNPRFHAFLKINQAKPECGRQTLQDLMIRPVQRLPSISLLLNDILKHTNKNNPDYKKLDEALKAIKEVMAHINEDKRKTEGQLAMFDIFNDIEGCPAHLVSSHRSFVSKCEVTELSDSLSGRGDSLVLYLFSDTIEACKKRSRGFNSGKSPSTTKSFKHVKLMPLSTIRFVIDICDSPRAFAINCRHNQDNKEKFYSFIICDEEIDKIIYLRSLCKQMAENACRTDTEKPLLSMTSQELHVDISDVNISTLSKAFKFATRTRLKMFQEIFVGRAFSFNKTPSKLKRAVSTMMTSPFGSTNSLTPASQLAQMKLASCTNINEYGEDEDCPESPTRSEPPLVAPMSVQPTRKVKMPLISMASLRKL